MRFNIYKGGIDCTEPLENTLVLSVKDMLLLAMLELQ